MEPTPRYYDVVGRFRRVFLTGGSGYLGRYLLHELLSSTPAEVHCLVRGRSVEMSRLRLETSLKRSNLWRPDFSDRIKIWSGDLEKPQFGLTDEQFNKLRNEIDHIIHCGAKVSWTSTFQALEQANVKSCHDVMALSQNSIPISYISSIGVLMADRSSLAEGFDEDDPPAPSVKKLGGYVESKWAAENHMNNQLAAGAPIKIFRPGLICGPMNDGYMHGDYLFTVTVKAMMESGKSFRAYNYWDITPVDYAAKAILYLANETGIDRKVFHIVNSTGRTSVEIAEMIGHYGYPLECIDAGDWENLMRHQCNTPGHAFTHMKSLLDNSQGPSFFSHYLNSPMLFGIKTRRLLEPAGVVCPVFDHVYFKPYLDFMITSGIVRAKGPATAAAPLRSLPIEKLGRFVAHLKVKPLSAGNEQRPAATEPEILNFGDQSAPAGIQAAQFPSASKTSPIRILFDLSQVLSPLKNYQFFMDRMNSISKTLFETCRLLEDRDGQSILVHVANAVDAEGRIHPAAGFIRGFFRALAWELPKTQLHVVLSDANYASMKPLLDREQFSNREDVTATYIKGVRHVYFSQECGAFDADSGPWIKDGDVILFTGGGRGIGGLLSKELSHQFKNCKFILIGKALPGRTQPIRTAVAAQFGEFNQENFIKFRRAEGKNKIDLRATVEEFERLTAEAELEINLEKLSDARVHFKYYSCDITDLDATQKCIADAYREFGRIDVVIHGAGAERSKQLSQKVWPDFQQIVAMKVDGFLNLASSLKLDELRQWINFGSMVSWHGNNGQTDYSAANDCLNSMAAHFNERFPNARFTTLNWHAWRDVGIVSRSRNLQAILEQKNIHPVEAQAGVDFFMNEAVVGRKEDSQIFYFARPDAEFFRVGQPPATPDL